MRRGQSSILSAVFLVAIAAAISVSAYSFFRSFQSSNQSLSASSESVIGRIPPKVDIAYVQPPTSTRGAVFCSIIRNMSDASISLHHVVVYIFHNGRLIASETNTYNDCGGVLLPNGTCQVCAQLSLPAGDYTYKITYSSVPPSEGKFTVSRTATTVMPDRPDLSVKSISAYQGEYDSGTLLFGDYNAFDLNVVVCNTGELNMAQTAELYLSSSNAKLSSSSLSVPQLEANHCVTLTTSGVTTAPTDVSVTAKLSYPLPEVSTSNNTKSVTFANAYFLECSTASACESDLNSALKFVNSSDTDTNAYVVLTADIDGNYVQFPSGDYEWRVVFDGNNHSITNSSAKAIYLNSSKNVYLTDLNLFTSGNGVLYSPVFLEYSTASISNSRIYSTASYSSAIYLSDSSAAVVNSQLFVGGKGSADLFSGGSPSFVALRGVHLDANLQNDSYYFTMGLAVTSSKDSTCGDDNEPILSINSSNYAEFNGATLATSKYCHISIYETNNVILHFSGHTDTNSQFIQIYKSNNVNITGLSLLLSGRLDLAGAIQLSGSHSITLSNSVVTEAGQSRSPIIAVASSLNMVDCNISTRGFDTWAIELDNKSSATILDSNILTYNQYAYALRLSSSSVTIAGSTVSTYNYYSPPVYADSSSSITMDLTSGDVRVCANKSDAFSGGTYTCQGCSTGANKLTWYGKESSIAFCTTCSEKATSYDACVGGG